MTRWVLLLGVLVLMTGCSTLTTQGADKAPVLHRKVYDKDMVLLEHVTVTLDATQSGRSCQLLEITRDGDVSFWQEQDGTSDWIIGRVVHATLPETIGVIMGALTAPFDLVLDLVQGRPEIRGPSPVPACLGLLESKASQSLLEKLIGGGH